MLQEMHSRPLIIAERHNEALNTFQLYQYLKEKDSAYKVDYILFEGALTPQEHIVQAEKAFKLYWSMIQNFLGHKNNTKTHQFLMFDLTQEVSEVSNQEKFAKELLEFPYGFGQIRNLSVHFLIYQHLKPQQTEWITIDNKRRVIKEFAQKKVLDGSAYLYKSHKYVGKITTMQQKVLLEASIIRSKYMADYIIHYAYKGSVIGLVGCRHCYDIVHYVPDLVDIFGYHPFQDQDLNLYHYNVQKKDIMFNIIGKNAHFDVYCRPVMPYNSTRLKSDFDLKRDYLVYLDCLKDNL